MTWCVFFCFVFYFVYQEFIAAEVLKLYGLTKDQSQKTDWQKMLKFGRKKRDRVDHILVGRKIKCFVCLFVFFIFEIESKPGCIFWGLKVWHIDIHDYSI